MKTFVFKGVLYIIIFIYPIIANAEYLYNGQIWDKYNLKYYVYYNTTSQLTYSQRQTATDGSGINISLIAANAGSEQTDYNAAMMSVEYDATKLTGWTLTIANYMTGQVMYYGTAETTDVYVNTSTWDNGIYVIRAQMGEYSFSKKIRIN